MMWTYQQWRMYWQTASYGVEAISDGVWLHREYMAYCTEWKGRAAMAKQRLNMSFGRYAK